MIFGRNWLGYGSSKNIENTIPLSIGRDDQWGLLTRWLAQMDSERLSLRLGLGLGVEDEELLPWPIAIQSQKTQQ